MKLRGIVIDEEPFYDICKKYGITNPDWIDGIINEFERKIPNFIEQAIKAFQDWVATEGNSNPGPKN